MSLLPEISQASAEINKLVAQANIHQTIAQVNPAEFTSPADTLLLASRDPVIREVSVGMTGVEAVQNTVYGTPPLSLPNSLGKPLKAWSVDLLPYQEGTGDPAPDNVRPIHGTDKLNLFVEESYDQSATPKAVLTLPQTVYTGTIGSEGGESRQRKIVLNGSENWTGSNTQGIYIQLSDMKKLTSYTANNSILCENLSVVSNNGNLTDFSITGYVDWANRYPTNNWLYIRIDDEHPDATSVKEWLAEHPVTIVYELATPVQFAVTAPTIPTPTGTATTWATAEDGTVESMEVTYIKSE